MPAEHQRDPARLNRFDLLSDYLDIANSRPGALIATALRTRSESIRDIFVHAALGSDLTSGQLSHQLLATDQLPKVKNFSALADLGRLVLLQKLLPRDSNYGSKLLTMALEMSPQKELSEENMRVLIQHQIEVGERAQAWSLLDSAPAIDDEFHGYLRAELFNPYTLGSPTTGEEWLREFNDVFYQQGISSIELSGDHSLSAFDQVYGIQNPANKGFKSGQLVSVIMTSYRPDKKRLHTSVRSLLSQTWQNLEIIIVNDGSGPAYDGLFDSIENLDDRISVIHARKNSGAYPARNLGYAASNGSFLTGQDDDDWSHPERIQRQVEYLEANPEMIGCRVMAVTCDENLGRVRIGYGPFSDNASSLLIHREGYELTGGFLESRKAADTEFFYRVQKVLERPVGTLEKCLTLIRVLPQSLSRSEFAPGWRHSARRSFRSSYSFWHRNATKKELRLNQGAQPKVKIPRRYEPGSGTKKDFSVDVLFAGDWQQYGGPQKSMLEEIAALLGAGWKVGILNLESARFMNRAGQAPLIDEVQLLINDGRVHEVLYDDEAHVQLLILRYPPILQFFTFDKSQLSVQSMIILANQAPSERDGSDTRYIVRDCHQNAEEAFGVTPVWAPQGPLVRESLESYLSSPLLADFDIPGILNLDEWWHEKLWYRSVHPVIGRHSRDSKMKWPSDREELSKIYPVDGSADVRIMGSRKTPLRVLGLSQAPPGWILYKRDEMPVKEFLSSIDFFVYYHHPAAVEAFGRAILEALAAGTVVILPPHFEKVFGTAAIYSDADHVQDLIVSLHADFSVYRNQLERSRAVLRESFSYESYRKRVASIISTISSYRSE